MKKTSKILSVILAIAIFMQMPMTAFAQSSSKSNYTGSTYTHQDKFDGYDIINGIDVSQHNGTIDFNKVKADGIDFAFIRVGYTGYTKSSFSLNYDSKYKTYLNDAINAGLKVGVYWYSQAVTTAEAIQEASKLLTAIEGYNITMPVVFDYEFAGTASGRLDSAKLSKDKMTANAMAFLDTVASAGYEACIYASANFLRDKLNAAEISSVYKVWLAHYTTKTAYAGDYDYWQYSSSGKVSGISSRVDMNFWYVNSNIIELENQFYTGAPITPLPAVIYNNIILTKDIDYTLTYSDNINPGTATIIATGINNYAGFSAKYQFKIIPYTVTGVNITGVTDTTISLNWTPIQNAYQYRVYVTNNTYSTAFSKTVTTNNCTLNNLTAGNNYTVYVCAGIKSTSQNVIWGDYSQGINVSTTGNSISGLKVKSSSTSAIRLTWNKLSDVQYYIVYIYSSETGSYIKDGQTDGNTNNYLVSGLSAGKTYKFRVSPVKNGFEGKKSNYLKAVTKPKKASIKSAKSSAKKKITVKWSSQSASGYQIQWSTKKNFSSNYKTVTVSSGTKSKTIKTAKSKTKYYVRVRAFTKANGVKSYGKWSSVKAVNVK
ncbi:MAG: GH25 family lysozyme [Eubacterium sp.]